MWLWLTTALAFANILLFGVQGSKVCTTPTCQTAANQVSGYMDTTKDPCQDFYSFACGGFGQKNQAQANKEVSTHMQLKTRILTTMGQQFQKMSYSDTTLPESVRTAVYAYNSCMNSKIDPTGADIRYLIGNLTDGTKSIGGWPIVSKNWREVDIAGLVGTIEATYAQGALINSAVLSDWGDPTQHSIHLRRAPLIMGSKMQYTSPFFQADRDAYVNAIVRIAKLLRTDYNIPTANITDAQIMQDAQDVLSLETGLAQMKAKSTEQNNYQFQYNPMSFTQLQNRWKYINWTKYYDNLLGQHNPNYLPTLKQRIIVEDPTFISEVHNDLRKYTARQVINYIVWRVLMQNLQFFPASSQYYKVWKDFQVATTAVSPYAPGTSPACAQAVQQSMPFPAGYVYATKLFTANQQKGITDVQNMLLNIRSSFSKMITDANWIETASQNALQDKIALKTLVGWPSWVIKNMPGLDALYSDFIQNITPNNTSSWFQIQQEMLFYNRKMHYQQLSQKITAQTYPPIDYCYNSPAATKPQYCTVKNSLFVPAAILNPPYYHVDYPNYLNYGGLGQALSFLYTFPLSYLGLQFDKTGKLNQVLSYNASLALSKKLQCISSHASKYCYDASLNYLCVDGAKTVNSNFMEMTAIQLAYLAYKEKAAVLNTPDPLLPNINYNQDQLFFISYAQSRCHSYTPQQRKQILVQGSPIRNGPPADLQILASLQNLDIFGKAFQCKLGSKMYPPQSTQCPKIYSVTKPAPTVTPQPTLQPASPTPYPYTTPGWKDAGKMLKNAIDVRGNPCNDFYEYACGGWLQQNTSPGTQNVGTSWSQEQKIFAAINDTLYKVNTNDTLIPNTLKAAKHFYDSCQNATISNVLSLNKTLSGLSAGAGYPAITPNWNAALISKNFSYNLWTDIAEVETNYLSPSILQSFVTIDWKNGKQNALYIDPAPPALGTRQVYINPAFKQTIVSYQNLIYNAFVALTHELPTIITPAHMSAAAASIVNFETQLANIGISDYKKWTNIQLAYNEFTLEGLKYRWPLIDWHVYAKLVTFLHTGQIEKRYVITEPSYVDKLHALIQKTPVETLINYVGWRLILNNMYFVNTQTRQLLTEFQEKHSYLKLDLPLPGFGCAKQLVQYMPFGAARLYLGLNPNPQQYDAVRTAASFTLQKIILGLEQAVQMGKMFDSATMFKSTQKLNGIVSDIGFPSFIMNNKSLDFFHRRYNYEITNSNGSYFWTNLQNLKRGSYTSMFAQLLNNTADRKQWVLSPAWNVALYQIDRNAVTMGIGLLMSSTSAKFRMDYPQAVNFGIMGSQVGMQLGNSINNYGVQFARNGSISSWPTTQSMVQLGQATKCLENQYNRYCYPSLNNICVNGRLSAPSNMADLIGVKAAYNGFKASQAYYGKDPPLPGAEGYSNDQVFFLSFAYGLCAKSSPMKTHLDLINGYTPNKIRVNAVLKNIPQFGKAFGCNPGNVMFPQSSQICQIP